MRKKDNKSEIQEKRERAREGKEREKKGIVEILPKGKLRRESDKIYDGEGGGSQKV